MVDPEQFFHVSLILSPQNRRLTPIRCLVHEPVRDAQRLMVPTSMIRSHLYIKVKNNVQNYSLYRVTSNTYINIIYIIQFDLTMHFFSRHILYL